MVVVSGKWKRLLRASAALLLTVCMVACSSKTEVSPLAEIGQSRFGAQDEFLTFEVPDEEEDPFKLSRSTPAGRRLSELFTIGERSVLKIIIGGPSSEATKNAIVEAFSANEGRLLGGLEIIFVGDLIDARAVADAAKPYLATVHFSSLAALQSAGGLSQDQ